MRSSVKSSRQPRAAERPVISRPTLTARPARPARAAQPAPTAEWASLAGLVVRAAAAAVWMIAGASKLPILLELPAQVMRYGILPERLAVPFALALPFLEMVLGAYLLAGLFVRATALAGTILFAAFLAAQIRAMALGLSLDCGCFGVIAHTRVGPLTLVRDFALGIPTFLMLALPARRMSLDRRLFDAPDVFGALLTVRRGQETAVDPRPR